MARGFNVGMFRSEINRKGGVLRVNRFLVEFNLPRGLRGVEGAEDLTDTMRTLEYWCEDVHLPSFGLTTYDIQRYGYGAAERRVTGYRAREVQVLFREMADASIQKLFHRWMNLIYNIDMSRGPTERTGEVTTGNGLFGGSTRAYEPYELTYRQDYLTDISIKIYDLTGELVRQVTLRDALPVVVGQVHLHWQDNNSYFRLPVSFAYTDFFEDNIYEQFNLLDLF